MVRRQNNNNDKSTIALPGRWALTWLPLVGALLTAGSVCLHTIGAIAHRAFLHEFGVPPDLFPKDVSWVLINGFYALLDRWHLLFKAYADRPLQFVLYGILATVVLIAYWYLYRWNPKQTEWTRKLPPWAKAGLRFLSLCIVIGGSLPAAVCLVLLLMIAIGAPGEFAGKSQAQKLLDLYAKGCSVDALCTSVQKNEKLLLTGPILDASQSHIAIYDPQTDVSHVLETTGLELRRQPRKAEH